MYIHVMRVCSLHVCVGVRHECVFVCFCVCIMHIRTSVYDHHPCLCLCERDVHVYVSVCMGGAAPYVCMCVGACVYVCACFVCEREYVCPPLQICVVPKP